MAKYALAQIRWTRARPSGQPSEDVMVNAIHFQCSDAGLVSDDASTFTEAWTDMLNEVQSGFAGHTHLEELRFYNVPATAGPLGDPAFTTSPTWAGSGSNDSTLPPQCALSVTLKTAIRRRWGRFYLGGLTANALFDGRIDPTFLGTLATAVDTWGTTLRSNGNGLVVWHRQSWVPQDVQEWSIDDVWDVIRRRRFDHAFNRSSGDFLS